MYESVDVANLLSDTYEVIFGPIHGELLASQLNDTLMHQPRLQFEDAELIITSVNFYQHTVTLITWDAASGGDEANSTSSFDVSPKNFTGSAISYCISLTKLTILFQLFCFQG